MHDEKRLSRRRRDPWPKSRRPRRATSSSSQTATCETAPSSAERDTDREIRSSHEGLSWALSRRESHASIRARLEGETRRCGLHSTRIPYLVEDSANPHHRPLGGEPRHAATTTTSAPSDRTTGKRWSIPREGMSDVQALRSLRSPISFSGSSTVDQRRRRSPRRRDQLRNPSGPKSSVRTTEGTTKR